MQHTMTIELQASALILTILVIHAPPKKLECMQTVKLANAESVKDKQSFVVIHVELVCLVEVELCILVACAI